MEQAHLAYEYYYEARRAFESLLARLRVDIEQYATQQNANQRRIDIQNEMIAKCLAYMQASTNAIEAMQQDIENHKIAAAQAYGRGFLAGEKAAQEAPERWQDKEAWRHWHETQVRKKWEDHYQPWTNQDKPLNK